MNERAKRILELLSGCTTTPRVMLEVAFLIADAALAEGRLESMQEHVETLKAELAAAKDRERSIRHKLYGRQGTVHD